MRRTLLVSCDLLRESDPTPGYSVACLLARLRQDPGYGTDFSVRHVSVNLLRYPPASHPDSLRRAVEGLDLSSFDVLALSCFIWSESLVNPFLEWVRQVGFRGRIVLGGSQITYGIAGSASLDDGRELSRAYPRADQFVPGHAENALLEICRRETPGRVISRWAPLQALPSPYLDKVIEFPEAAGSVRMETQRGCPFSCDFCAHRDIVTSMVERTTVERALQEFFLLQEAGVRKVNVLDPVFNAGPRALAVLDAAVEAGLSARLSLQCRFENLTTAFLDTCEALNVELEFGLQTTDETEAAEINRPNDMAAVERWIAELNRRGLTYEVSMIYGLPLQTLDSFRRGIHWLRDRGVETIKAWPLMLLRGTRMHSRKARYGMRERTEGPYNIPVVVASTSFTEHEWDGMKTASVDLLKPARL